MAKLTTYPIGTLEEIKEVGRLPIHTHTCSKPVKNESLGCPFWDICDKHFKGKEYDGPGTAGPENEGVEMIQSGTNGRRMVGRETLACYVYWLIYHRIRGNGGAVRAVAQVGETYKTRTSEVTVTGYSGGKEKIAVNRSRDTEVEVKPFPRPSERDEYQMDAFAEEVLEEASEKDDADRLSRLIGTRKKPKATKKRVSSDEEPATAGTEGTH